MKLKIKYILIAVAFLGLTIVSNAQEYLSVEKCRELVLKNSENVQIANMQIEKAKAEKAALKTMFLPKVSASLTGAYLAKNLEYELYLPTVTPDAATGELKPNLMINPATGMPVAGVNGDYIFNIYAWLPLEVSLKGAYMAGVKIEQPIYTGGKILTGNKMAAIGMEMAGENQELQEIIALVEADQAYWLYVSVAEKVKLAGKYQQLLLSLVETIKNSYEIGMVNQNEFLKVQVKFNAVSLELQKAQSGLQLTRMSLCRLAGLDFSTSIVATDTLIAISNELISAFGNENIAQRPEYRLMQQSIEMETESIRMARADYLPTSGISAGYNYLGGIKVNNSEIINGNVSIMASLQIPVFHWGEGVRKTTSAKLEKSIKELEMQKNVQLMNLEIEQAKLNLKDALTRIEMAGKAVYQADENLRVSTDNYEIGTEILVNLLDAQAQWQAVYSELIDAKTDFKLKEIAYLKASGKIVPAK